MYEYNANQMILPDEFFLLFRGQLNPDNLWVVMCLWQNNVKAHNSAA
ncbi:hypothetical protein [Lentibacillus salicampi]|nr:hypothetical protein [Lentibacillus salicampi]